MAEHSPIQKPLLNTKKGPVDAANKVASIEAFGELPTDVKWHGMRVHVDGIGWHEYDEMLDALVPLTNNSNSTTPLEVRIQGAIVDTEGKTNLLEFEQHDKFRYHYSDGFVVGIIKNVPVTLPDDLFDINKIELQVRN